MSKIRINQSSTFIRDRKDFQCYGSMSGKNYGPNSFPVNTGILRDEYRKELRNDESTAKNGIYVVKSYDTPIAWYTEEFGWKMPDTKYSVTTSKHQTNARMGINY